MVTTNTTGSAGTFRWYKDGSLTQSHGTGDSIAPADTTITQVYYVIEDRLGCLSAADTTTVTINALPSVSNTSLTNRCTNEDTVVLATGSPSGGTYSGNGVWNNIFYPDSAGSGSHVITYSYTDGNNCTNDDTASVTIYQAPVTALAAQDSSCTNAQSYALTGGTPTGGTYSGFGVSSGNFDPATAGIGLHTIQYKVTNTNCADSSQASIRVHQAPTATISTIADRCEDAATLTLSVGSPSGGVYIGNGVSGGVFDPSMAGPGSHTIKYVYTDNNQCMDSANTTAQVDSLPMVMFGTLNDVCANTPQFPLTQGSASPTGGTGTYFGTGVTSPDFDPASAGAGSYSLGYAYVDANGCRDTAYSTQQVDTVPVVTWTASLNDVCLNGGPKTLSGGLPSGGMYNGSGVNSGIFYPDSAGAGSHSLYYVFTDGNNCTDSAGQAQLVDPLPAVSFSLPNNWCLNDSPISLNNGTPMGGVYTINGTVDTVYQTTVSKVDTVIYAYTDTNNCTNWDTAMIKADTVPVVTFGSVPDVCINSGALNFTQGAPMGGWYTGNRVRLVATYDPLVATTDTITYHFMDANNCSDSTTSTITVNPLPVVNITAQADVCENTPTFAMSGGTPTGGTYKGAGVSSNNYTASTFGVGTDNITYVYVDGNNCTDSATTSLVVHKVDDAKFNFMFGVCDNGDLHDLTPFGLPKGGTFKGNSVSGNDFDPKAAGVGTYSLTYVYTNSNSCQDSASRDITVEASPVFNIVGVRLEACDNNPAVLTTSLSGQAQYTYHWKDGSRGDTAYVRQGGDMWVKVTDGSTDDLCANYDTISGITYDAICVGIDEQLTGTSVRYYPNPNQGHFFYELEGFEGLDVDVTIHSATGQVVYETTLRNVSNFYSGEIEVESFESGVYFINLSTERGNVMHRITLNR
jgi:hypothetical protein